MATNEPPPTGILFTRLTEIPLEALRTHMSDPRVHEHMPLAAGAWDLKRCAELVAAKEACWARDGLGHWAFVENGTYLGWGGFQNEGQKGANEWDFGLVLTPSAFGSGMRIARQALAFAAADPRIPFVTFLLPKSRKNLRVLDRLGASFIATVEHQGHAFSKYRLDTPTT